VGLNLIQAARSAGATSVVAVDINDAKLTAAARFGATRAVNSRSEDVTQAVRE
jgi:Zn-dependent alcohol dehydrogenase